MKISIIIPTIGRKTLSSVLKALLKNKKSIQCEIEIIVVFDGQTPGKGQMEGVVYHGTPEKVYAGGARNLGIEKATGDVLVFLGDDTIPTPGFLERLCAWHTEHPEEHEALLGQVRWTAALAKDPFHQWLGGNAQFDFKRLNVGRPPSWRHFYTSNISVKRSLMKDERFSDQFAGWGFEDIEFGYRLAQQGMTLHYDQDLVVLHDDPQTESGLIKRTKAARKNALVFEQLHPEVNILPTGTKKLVLNGMWYGLSVLNFIPQVRWWRMWKKAWTS